MEAVEEPPLQNVVAEVIKVNATKCEESTEGEVSAQSDVCHRTNGNTDSTDVEQVQPAIEENVIREEEQPAHVVADKENVTETVEVELQQTPAEIVVHEPIEGDDVKNEDVSSLENAYDPDTKTDTNEDMQTEDVVVDGIVETMPENVRFETEILIETNVEDQTSKYTIIYDDVENPEHSNNILNQLGQNIELSEVLRSSDVTDNVENNNCEVQQEVFNKEELLDILEGNDVDESRKEISENLDSSDCKMLETQLALQQLSRLQSGRRPRHTTKKSDKKTPKKIYLQKDEIIKKKSDPPKESTKKKNESSKDEGGKKSDSPKEEGAKKRSDSSKQEALKKSNDAPNEESVKKKNIKQKVDISQNDITICNESEPKEESIVNALVKDWEDDEPSEGDQTKNIVKDESTVEELEEPAKSEEISAKESETSQENTSVVEEQAVNLNKSDSESQPQRRLGRVIKKKVIFDPDNPDTFTKSKTTIKKESLLDKDQKDQPTPKKIKTDPISPRSKSKSPVQSKLQWKKPQPKNMKQNKRLTEIDRLLMDEGAVNMICQLTPEAPKGHKNMKSKAEFIKKIQSSTPEGKEMKFRERKKESKSEEGDAKRIGGAKERLSLSSSVKSPAVSEDFEAHSADDSIIYRRHSSSSYSSPCMSPRRLSDVESISQNVQALSQNALMTQNQSQAEDGVPTGSDVFLSQNAGSLTTTVINKSDFLSIKEKLNTKLSQALNKRKRDSIKAEKPSKIKKVSKSIEKPTVTEDYKYVRLTINKNVAEISIQEAGSMYNIEVFNELKLILDTVENKQDVSVTLLSAQSGTLCSGIDLKPLLDQEKSNYALELAESARLLLSTLETHSKLLCTVVENRCHGLGLSLVVLSDIVVASELVTFELSTHKDLPLQPGAAVLTACGLPQSLINEIIVMERPISAAEAVQSGLVSRTVWPERVLDQARAIALDIAAQPIEKLMLKKQLLRLKRGGSIMASLEMERDLFIRYWTSAECKELVRANLDTAKQ